MMAVVRGRGSAYVILPGSGDNNAKAGVPRFAACRVRKPVVFTNADTGSLPRRVRSWRADSHAFVMRVCRRRSDLTGRSLEHGRGHVDEQAAAAGVGRDELCAIVRK